MFSSSTARHRNNNAKYTPIGSSSSRSSNTFSSYWMQLLGAVCLLTVGFIVGRTFTQSAELHPTINPPSNVRVDDRYHQQQSSYEEPVYINNNNQEQNDQVQAPISPSWRRLMHLDESTVREVLCDDDFEAYTGYKPKFVFMAGLEGSGHHLYQMLWKEVAFDYSDLPAGTQVRTMSPSRHLEVSDLFMKMWAYNTGWGAPNGDFSKEVYGGRNPGATLTDYVRTRQILDGYLDDHLSCRGPTDNPNLVEEPDYQQCPPGVVPGSVSMLHPAVRWQQAYPFGYPRQDVSLRRPNIAEMVRRLNRFFDMRIVISRRQLTNVMLSTVGSRFEKFMPFVQQAKIIQDQMIYMNSDILLLHPRNFAIVDYDQITEEHTRFIRPMAAFLGVTLDSMRIALEEANPSGHPHKYKTFHNEPEAQHIDEMFKGIQTNRWSAMSSEAFNILNDEAARIRMAGPLRCISESFTVWKGDGDDTEVPPFRSELVSGEP